MKRLFLLIILVVSSLPAWSQGHSFSGRVVEKETGDPVEFATVLVNATEQWAVTDAEGRFSIQNIKAGKSLVTVASLGYATLSREFSFAKDIADCKLQLEADNLLLQSAVVTAKENDNAATTSRTIDRTALEHVQVMNVGDIASLLPGGVTTDNNLVNRKEFNIRAGDRSESGNASFGTAVEVDGVRLSNNASYSETRGVSTNSIASSNVESVEVITGVPSVEYGDMGSGVVKINTKKGKTPWMVTLSTSPKTKQASFSKGFELGKTRRNNSRGILNASAEYTRSVSDVMSPYESYDRKSLSLIYSNSFTDGAFRNRPLRISVGVTGNLGGLDDKADPDKMVGTFATVRDNALRANLNANWLLSLPWITNIELTASTAISDKLSRERKNYYSSVSDIALHTRETGYYMSAPYAADGANDVVMIPPGSRYSTLAVDDRPVTAKATLKANWAAHWGRVNNKIKLGADWNFDANLGVGAYAEDPATAPTWREYRYCDNPAMHNLAAYAEDNLSFPLGKGHVNVIAGLRADNTFIKGSAYGTTSSLSPRFNVKYTVLDSFGRSREFVRELAVRASWGVAVKLPSFSVLFPTPSYQDINVFTATATADNTVYRAYYVLPRTIEYNPALRWQRNRQGEAGIEANLAGTRVSLAAFYNQTLNAYRLRTEYDRFTYNNTGTAASQGLSIPAENRVFSIDGTTGIVTVTDKTGAQPSQTLASELRKQLIPKTTADNASHPVTRWGLEWVVDFRKIESIGTTVRLDGSYYSYKTLDTDMKAYAPYSQTASGGIPYPYIGFFYGGNGYSNGSETRTLRNNVTITTHIPKVRMIVSVKLEASLLRYSRSLSEREGATRTYVLRDRSNLLSYDPSASIYDGDSYAVTYPDYYVSYDDPDTQVPFLEKLSWAKENAPTLYADLSKLVTTTSYRYMFDKDYISPYFSANFSITKELGDRASVSFYANNFFNNMGQVYSTKERNYKSVSTYIPTFYYGLTVRIKF